MANAANKTERIVPSSGNVFADLGLPDAVELDTKSRLVVAINQALEARKLTQASAAALLGINQPKVSALKNFRIDGFSVERLMTFLAALGSDIEIRFRAPPRVTSKPGRIVVTEERPKSRHRGSARQPTTF